MEKILLLIAFLPSIFSCDSIWNNGPTDLLYQIFKITGKKNGKTLEDAIKLTSAWIRPSFLERWHTYNLIDRSQRVELEKLIKDSDLAKVKMPKLKYYDIVVVLGAATGRVRTRIDFLIGLVNEGVNFKKVYLLGSNRKLREGSDEDKKLAPILKAKNINPNEIAMVEYLWQRADKPQSLTHLPVCSFMGIEPSYGARAGLADTLAAMISNTEIAKGTSFLLISNNPYICFHDAIAKKFLKPYEVTIETVGPAMSEQTTVEDIIDSVARCLLNIERATT